jgi:hypothetical protein
MYRVAITNHVVPRNRSTSTEITISRRDENGDIVHLSWAQRSARPPLFSTCDLANAVDQTSMRNEPCRRVAETGFAVRQNPRQEAIDRGVVQLELTRCFEGSRRSSGV